ncbi:MAG TPA: hypothetical protein PKA82_17565 [Pyrinomonadaceae bacterium]|nr:hypothetical protein [Pyrinomonadaceae bacterium]
MSELVVNPYLQMEEMSDDSELVVLKAPNPGRGLSIWNISRDEQPRLFELLSEIGPENVRLLDVENDLNDDDRETLRSHGVLVEADRQPSLPLFSCELSDIEPRSFDGELRVNHTFRFEPFDLTRFSESINKRHISPFKASVWIAYPTSGVEIGYWLEPKDAEVVSKFEPSNHASIDDAELRGRLYAAGILVDSSSTDEETICEASASFAEKKYAVVERLLPPEQMAAMRRYYRDYVSNGFMHFGDTQVGGRYREQNEPIAVMLHHQLTNVVSRVSGREVKPSYVYAASYVGGADLAPHVDRLQCEYSISLQIDYEPEPEGHVSPWALSLEQLDKSLAPEPMGLYLGWEYLSDSRPSVHLNLASGDGLLYMGREMVHYRTALPAGHSSTSLFLHYVDADFDGSLE